MPDPIYKDKKGQKVTKKQLLDSGYTEDRINKGIENGILTNIGDTDLPEQSYKTKDGQIVTTKQLIESGYSQDRINQGVYNGILSPEDSTVKKKVGGGGSGATTTSTSSGEFPLLYSRKAKTESLPAVAPARTQKEKPVTAKEVQDFVQTEFKPTVTNPTDKDIEVNLTNDLNKDIENYSGDDPLRAILDPEQKIKYTLPDGTPDYRANARAFTKKIEILNNAFDSGESAKNFLQKGLFNESIENLAPEQIKELAGNNFTKQIAANRYEKLREVQEVLHNRTLDEASIYYAAKSDPNIKNFLDLAGGPGGDTKETSAIPLSVRGQKKLEFLMNPDVKAIAMQDPDRKREYDNEIANFPSHHPDFATKLLADAIAKRREDTGGNNWFANVVGKEATDKIVDDLITEGQFPASYKFLYQKTIRPKLGTWQSIGRGVGNAIPGLNQVVNESPIPTPGMVENFEQGFENFQVGAAKSLANVSGIQGQLQPEAQQTFNAIEKAASTPVLEPKGLLHKVSLHGGNLMGFVAGLAGTSSALGATKLLSPEVAQATAMVLATHGDSNERAKILFPGEKLKQATYVGTMDILNGVLGKYLPGQQIPKLLKPSENIIASTLTKMVDGEITTDAAKGVLTNLVANTVKGSLKGGEFMGAIAGVDDLLTQTLQGKGIDFAQSTEKAWDAFKIGLLATGPLSLMEAGLKSNKPFRNEILSMADNPDYYKELANREAETNPEFAKIKDDVIENIDYISKVKEETAGMKPKERSEYILNSLAEKVKLTKAEQATDPTIKKRLQKEAKDLHEIKEAALNGIPEEKVRRNQIIKEIKDLYDDDYLSKKARAAVESTKTEGGEPKFDESKVMSFLEEVAKSDELYPSGITELANEMFPEHGKAKQEAEMAASTQHAIEGFSIPKEETKSHVPEIELPPLPEGYNIVDQPTVKPNETKATEATAKPTEQIPTEKETGANGEPPEIIKPTEEGAGEPPSTPPVAEATGGDSQGETKNKALANRLVKAKNIPEVARGIIKSEGLEYEPRSHKEAEEIAKAILDEAGLEDGIIMARAQTFGGDVNTLVQTEALNRLKELEDNATEYKDKLKYAQQFAEISIELDKWAREKAGRGISALGFFYKKSPLGMQIVENTKRKEDFDQWSKPKEKSWKEFFDEMSKDPEFEEALKEKFFEEKKAERAKSRQERVKKVDAFFDKAKDQFKGGATYSTIIPPKIITAALEGMKKAYHAGEAIAKIVQDAIDYISKELGHDNWDKEKFRKEWDKNLKENEKTDEEKKERILKRFRNKLKGLPDKQKEDVVRKSFQQIVESGGLNYEDFRKIIAEVTGRGELTAEDAKRLKELVDKLNLVEEAGKKAMEERTPEALAQVRQAQFEAGFAARELNELLWNKPNIMKRLTSIMQLNTLGLPSLINNPIYNIWNQMFVRLPTVSINDIIDRTFAGIYSLAGKNYVREYNTFETQADFFEKLGLGTKESFEQLRTGLNRRDYISKEIYGQQIRPARAWGDLIAAMRGKKRLTVAQTIDKGLQGTVGVPAEIVARILNLGDKPQRFGAEGAQAGAFAKSLGLKGINYKLFLEFPREEAYRAYKTKGMSDAEAGKKADYIRDSIVKEGERSTFQQDNMLNDLLNRLFGGEKSGIGSFVKAVTISPFIKIPSNAFWSFYNLVNPEVAMLQAMYHGGKSLNIKSKDEVKSRLQLREARYWMAHAVVGIGMRAVITSMVGAGVYTSANTEDDTKKEREGEAFYETQGGLNVTKLFAWLRGEDASKIDNGLVVQNRWFGPFGTVGNTIARQHEEMTPEQRANKQDFWDAAFGGMEKEALQDLEQGVFSNTSSLLSGLNSSYGLERWGMNTINMMTNVVEPATLSQLSRANNPNYSTNKADNFYDELKNNVKGRVFGLAGGYPPTKISIWGEPMKRSDNVLMRLFGVSSTNKDNFAQPIYEDYKKTGDVGFFPPAVRPELNGKKLTVEQSRVLETYIGQARKSYVAPYINDSATFPIYDKKYSEIEDMGMRKKIMEYLYAQGRADGIKKFTQDYPEFKEAEKTADDYVKDAYYEAFKTLIKVEHR